MMYLGNKAVGINNEVVGHRYTVNIAVNYSYITMDNFMNALVYPLLSSPPNDKSLFIDILFEDNTNNTRAGEYIRCVWSGGNSNSSIDVKRIGDNVFHSASYGVDVYSGAKLNILVIPVPRR